MKNIILLLSILLTLSACGGKKGGANNSEISSPPVQTQMPELRLLGPENGTRITTAVSISLQCTNGIDVLVTGDTPSETLACNGSTLTHTFSVLGDEGPKGIIFRQENAAGFSNLVVSLYKDITVPTCTFTSGFSFSNTLPLNIEFNCADNDRVKLIQCSFDGGSFSTCTSGSYLLNTLSQGPHTLEIKAYDDAQNQSLIQIKSFHHDSIAPSMSFSAHPPSITNSTSAHFEFSISESGSLVATTDCKLDGGSWQPCTSPVDYHSLSDGLHSIQLRSIDHAGNIGQSQFDWQIDLSPPTGYTITGVSGGVDVISDAFLSSGNEAYISWVDAAGESNYYLSILSSDGSIEICPEVTLPANTTQFGFTGCVLTSGVHYKAKLYAVDSMLNAGAFVYYNFLVTGWNDLNWATASSDYGSLNPGQILERVFTLSYSGDVPLQSLTGTISGSHFVFKGGSFPGVGGTCLSGVATDCTVIINYSPTSVGSHSATAQLSFNNGFETKNRSISLSGTATLPPPTKLAFSAQSGVASGDCATIQIQSQTSEGINSSVASNTTVNFVVNNGSGAFYNSASCTTTTSTAVIGLGTSSTTIYFKSTTANQNLTLVATASGLSGATHYLNVGGAPTALLISGVSQSLQSTCVSFHVDRIDTNGYKIGAIGAQALTLTTSGTAQIFDDALCSNTQSAFTIPSNQTGTLFYVKSDQIESVVLTATGSGLTSDTHNLSIQASLSWWNASWSKRVRINISNLDQAEAFTNIPILLRLNSSNIQYGQIQPLGQDIRLIGSDDTTLLSHEIEVWNPSGESLVWVKVPSIAASSGDGFIYLYFGNNLASDGQNKSSVWSSYTAVWHLQESPASTAPQFKNAVGVNYNGTAENSPTSSLAIIGNGLNLNGNFDGFDVGSNLATVIGYSSTMTLWMKSTQVGNNTNWLAPGITGVEQAGGTNDIFFGWMDGAGKIAITAGDSTAAKSNFIVNDNNWRHVSMSRDHTTGTAKFYVNGVFNASSNTGVGAKTTPFQKIGIIGDTGGTPTEFDGYVDEIRLFNSVQTDGRIKADFKYQNGTHVTYSGIEQRP